MIKPDVMNALQEIQVAFPEAKFEWHEDPNGGAWFFLEPIDPGAVYSTRQIWFGADISAQYPYADIYPQFVCSSMKRVDDRQLGEAISTGHNFHGRPAIQLSRRSRNHNPQVDTVATKIIKVLEWLSTRP